MGEKGSGPRKEGEEEKEERADMRDSEEAGRPALGG